MDNLNLLKKLKDDCEFLTDRFSGLAEHEIADDIRQAIEELSEKEYDGQWETVHGVVTPGGDPWLRCPFCKAKNSEHLGGIEMPKQWRYCPNCGKKLWGDGYILVAKE